MAGHRDRIQRALEELLAAELNRLKATLNRLPVAAGYGTIPRGRMEGADALGLTELLVGCYGEGYGAAVAAEALRRIQRRDLADGLVGGEDPHRPRDRADDVTDQATAPSPEERFVARHRGDLIQRVRGVPALLDGLEAGGVLAPEEAAAVAAGATPQDQMRRLLATAPAWGRRGHRRFLCALRRLHPFLMEELEGAGGGRDGDGGEMVQTGGPGAP
ncbi:apoptosis-associated speck-like protein containing a CARD [Phalacrocorax carbo]|uniref:apoptosis-associated speck-like protein containing a CARD n=1 Tax=Phalacrocorax carbo TaxID=9209 RepID=UPI00311A8D8C